MILIKIQFKSRLHYIDIIQKICVMNLQKYFVPGIFGLAAADGQTSDKWSGK